MYVCIYVHQLWTCVNGTQMRCRNARSSRNSYNLICGRNICMQVQLLLTRALPFIDFQPHANTFGGKQAAHARPAIIFINLLQRLSARFACSTPTVSSRSWTLGCWPASFIAPVAILQLCHNAWVQTCVLLSLACILLALHYSQLGWYCWPLSRMKV